MAKRRVAEKLSQLDHLFTEAVLPGADDWADSGIDIHVDVIDTFRRALDAYLEELAVSSGIDASKIQALVDDHCATDQQMLLAGAKELLEIVARVKSIDHLLPQSSGNAFDRTAQMRWLRTYLAERFAAVFDAIAPVGAGRAPDFLPGRNSEASRANDPLYADVRRDFLSRRFASASKARTGRMASVRRVIEEMSKHGRYGPDRVSLTEATIDRILYPRSDTRRD